MCSCRPPTRPAAALRRGRARVSAVREPGTHVCATRVGAFHPLRARGAYRPSADPDPRNESEPRLYAARQGALAACLPPCRLGRFGRVVGGCVEHGFDRLPERAAVPSAAFARGSFDEAERGREALRSRGRDRRRYRGCDHRAPGVCWRTGSRCLRPRLEHRDQRSCVRRCRLHEAGHELRDVLELQHGRDLSRVRVDLARGCRFTRPRASGTGRSSSRIGYRGSDSPVWIEGERSCSCRRGRRDRACPLPALGADARRPLDSRPADRWPASHGAALWSPRGRGQRPARSQSDGHTS